MSNKSTPTTPINDNKWWAGLIIFGFISLLCFAWLAYSLLQVTDYISDVNQLEISSTNIVKDVNDATFSRDFEVSRAAYAKLSGDIQDYEAALTRLQGNSLMGHGSTFKELNEAWLAQKQNADFIIAHQNDINALQDIQKQIKDATASMQEQYMLVTDQAMAVRMPAATLREIQGQVIRLERINEEMTALTSTAGANPEGFKRHLNEFVSTLNGQKTSFGQAAPALQGISATYDNMVAPVVSGFDDMNSPAIQSRQAAQGLSDIVSTTQDKLAPVERSIIGQKSIFIPAILLAISMVIALIALLKLFKNRSYAERLARDRENMHRNLEMEAKAELARLESDRIQKMEREKENSQAAILRLLEELGDLADGDLTTTATVTEDFTGAIADSVNVAIDQLRQLVLAINATADKVALSSQQTQMTAVELAEASEHQAQEIAGVSAAISQMAVSIDQVSANASESAEVAQRSVAIAHNGAEVVHRSIEGMNIIRDQIQETAKRIKRLGESSQEIGNIVNLINDIADQTNILALNAAIQASMAGEAGRGFAVVADEVQRLAERSAAATRQIEILVKTIQADTNEAVSSMESTTAEVVKGAKLAKDAGEALDEVQTVSHTLADLIGNISNAARQQANSASHISNTMGVIQDITSQTSSGTMATARSVGRLNEMAAALQKSVSGFKLSDDDKQLAH